MRLHHIAYLVKDIDKAISAFNSIGYVPESLIGGDSIIYDDLRDCNICFLSNTLEYYNDLDESRKKYVELVCPKSEQSPIYGLLSKYKNNPYHLCFESSDPAADICNLKNNGWLVMQDDAPAVAFGDKHVTFFINRHIGIIELVYDPVSN